MRKISIVILNYNTGSVLLINDLCILDNQDSTEQIEKKLVEYGYNLDEIYWMVVNEDESMFYIGHEDDIDTHKNKDIIWDNWVRISDIGNYVGCD